MADRQKADSISIHLIEDICKCALCLDIYVDPKTLPCRHSFCSDCLDNLVQFKDNQKIMIKCPTCQKHFSNFSARMTVSKLKTELALVQMLDLLKPRSTGNRLTNTIQCAADDCKNIATIWNKIKERFECDKCYNLCTFILPPLHIKYSEKEESVEFFCDQHGCFQRMYCEDCNTPLCIYCQEWNHLYKTHVVKKKIEYYNSCKSSLEQYIANAKDMINTLELRHEETNSFISTSLSEIEDRIRELAKDLKNTLNKAVDNCKEEYLESFRNSMKNLLTEDTNALKVCQDIHKSGKELLQCPQSLELFCKTPGLGIKIGKLNKSYFHNTISFKEGVKSRIGNDTEKIEESIRQCFGSISVERNNACGYLIRPGCANISNVNGVSEHGRFCREELVTTISMTVDVETLKTTVNVYSLPTLFQKFTWILQIQIPLNVNKDETSEERKSIGCFLNIRSKQPEWTYKPIVQFRLKNVMDEDVTEDMNAVFDRENSAWGQDLISLKDLLDESNGYLVAGKFVAEAVIRAEVSENFNTAD